jgi:ABC-type nitrate/sulfonate/bicarbonate transport system permease component
LRTTKGKNGRVLSIISVIVFLLIWETLSSLNIINSTLFPSPSRIFNALMALALSGELWRDLFASLLRAFSGFLIGSLLGIFLGLICGRTRVFDYILSPFFQIFRPIPILALLPLAIIWFGLGEVSKIFLVSWGAFFPVWINTYLGVSRVEKTYLWAAQNLGADRSQLWRYVILPACAPPIVSGLRTAISLSFVVLVAAEMSGAYHGIGYRIGAYHLVFEIDKMMADISVLGLIGFLTDRGFALMIDRWLPWYSITLSQE